jgi:hypothetical protein
LPSPTLPVLAVLAIVSSKSRAKYP